MPQPRRRLRFYSIYFLFDPREIKYEIDRSAHVPKVVEASDSNPSVMYVGCTSKTLPIRLAAHVNAALSNESSTPILEWVRALIRENVEPEIRLIETTTKQEWEEREKYWIEKYQGPDLLNVARGGKGSPGAYPNREKRIKAVGDFFRGMPLREEHKAKISAAKMGHVMPEKVKQALIAANTGRKQSQETIDKRAQSIKAQGGYHHSDLVKAQISAAHKGKKNGPLPDEVKAKLSKSLSNLIWINDGSQNKRIQRGAIPDGWMPGRFGRTW